MPTRVGLLAVAAVVTATLTLMGAWTVRMALADYQFRRDTLAGTQSAIRLEPDNAAYYVRLAAAIPEEDPAGSGRALERAVALNPWDSRTWVELGLRAEADDDFGPAERFLLRAARVDQQFLPKWSLANYYFRRGDSGKFWFWARQAAGTAYGDLAPLFNLCWKVSSDAALIERRLDLRQADVEANYLAYLSAHNRMEPLLGMAMRLLRWNRAVDLPQLLSTSERLIADNRPNQAVQLWNGLAELHGIPFQELVPRSGSSLTNGDFIVFPTSRGFDWRLPDVKGITARLDERPAGLRISFSGSEPESCEIMTQFLPLMANSSYELRFLYLTEGISSTTGLGWRITDMIGSEVLAQGSILASEKESQSRLLFRTLAGSGMVRLTLAYQRVLGTTRIEGSLVLRKLRLKLKILEGATAH